MDIYNTKTHRALISPFIDLNIFGVHWRNSFSYDYTNMDEMRLYNPEHGNGAAVDGRLSKYAISDITSAISLVGKNAEFKEIHEYYRTRKENPLKKMQSVVAVACKIIRVFYTILTKGVDYDPMKLMSDIRRPQLQAA